MALCERLEHMCAVRHVLGSTQLEQRVTAPCGTSTTRVRSSLKRLLVSARMVPDSSTLSGMTLDAPGPAPGQNRTYTQQAPCVTGA